MKFRNKRTGNVIVVPCRLEGPDWEEMTEAKQDAPAAKAPEKAQTPSKAAPKKAAVRKGGKA